MRIFHKNMFKKCISSFFVGALFVGLCTGCNNDTKNRIDDVNIGTPQVHVTLDKYPFESEADGYVPTNEYYKKAKNSEGELCYVVLDASDGALDYLPLTQTVLYTSDADNCYYEKFTITYEQEGEKKEVEQYQLYVTANISSDTDVATLEGEEVVAE